MIDAAADEEAAVVGAQLLDVSRWLIRVMAKQQRQRLPLKSMKQCGANFVRSRSMSAVAAQPSKMSGVDGGDNSVGAESCLDAVLADQAAEAKAHLKAMPKVVASVASPRPESSSFFCAASSLPDVGEAGLCQDGALPQRLRRP